MRARESEECANASPLVLFPVYLARYVKIRLGFIRKLVRFELDLFKETKVIVGDVSFVSLLFLFLIVSQDLSAATTAPSVSRINRETWLDRG